MTKEEWESIERKLRYPGATVFLQIDGYLIGLQVQTYKMKMVIAVYADGHIKIEWAANDCEIRRRFYMCSKHSLLSASERKKLMKEKKAVREEIEKQCTYFSYSPYWTSFRSLKNHLIKNNDSIELYKEK